MNTIIKSFKFKGFKKFNEWVKIDFETNANKYQNKEYIRSFKYDDSSEIFHNSIIGIIGTNTSGKTSILEIINKYANFIQTGIAPFAKYERTNPFSRDRSHENHHAEPESFADLRGAFRGKLVKIFGDSNYFNVKSETIEIVVELVTEGMSLTHELCFHRDNRFTEDIFIKKRVNRNETTQQIFRKKLEQEISFKTFAALIENDEIVLSSKMPNIANSDIKKAEEAISMVGKTIVLVGETDLPFTTLSANPFFDDPEDDEDLNKKMSVLEKIVKVIDKSVIGVRKTHKFDNRFVEFEFVLEGDVVVKESALSTGTIKFANIILGGMASRKLIGKTNKYIMIDEIDNSWHPNLTKSFIGLLKEDDLLHDFTLICTFHNPYVSSEFREDALYVIPSDSYVKTWVQFKNDYNKMNPENKLRLEHSFQRKYLEDIIIGGPDDISAAFKKIKKAKEDAKCD